MPLADYYPCLAVGFLQFAIPLSHEPTSPFYTFYQMSTQCYTVSEKNGHMDQNPDLSVFFVR